MALNAAERHLDAGTAALVVNVGPIIVAVLAGLFLSEGFPRWLVIGSGIGFAGVAVITIGGRSTRQIDPVGWRSVWRPPCSTPAAWWRRRWPWPPSGR